MTAARILLVDDDPVLLQVLPETLTLKLYRIVVETSPSSVEALDLIKRTAYDVIVSDLKLPGLDGLELLDRIHQIRPGTPVLLMTGHGSGDIGSEALRRGAFAFLQKPLDREELVARMKRALMNRSPSGYCEGAS